MLRPREMQFKIERTKLFSALSHIQNAVEKKNTIPILSNILITCQNSNLLLTATDLDLSMVEVVAGEIISDGATTTPAHLFYDIVRKLPDGAQIELSTDNENSQIIIKSSRSKFSLPCLSKEEFPVISNDDLPHNFQISSKVLKKLLDKTKFAISTEETRYYLNGVYFHKPDNVDNPVMRSVATDGHRLAYTESKLPDGVSDIPSIIVPRKAVSEVRRLLDQFDEDINVSLSDAQMRFNIGTTTINTKLIDGTFPDYQRVIPEQNNKFMKVDRSDFVAAVDRVSTISTEKSRAIKLSIESNMMKISANSADTATAYEEVAIEYDSELIEIGFNSKYLLDITSHVEGSIINFSLSDSVSPAIITDDSDSQSLFVLMPMRV